MPDNKFYDWLHIPTKQIYFSVREDRLQRPVSEYLKDPDMSAVRGVPSRFWVVENGQVRPMTQAEADAARQADEEQVKNDQVDNEFASTRSVVKALALVFLDEINSLRADHGRQPYTPQQLRQAIRNKL